MTFISDDYAVKAYVTNLGKYNEGYLLGEWVTFPISEDEKEELFKRIGISDEPDEYGNYYEEYFITDYDSRLPLAKDYGEYVNIDTLNELAESLERLNEYQMKKLLAILDADLWWSVEQAVDHVDDYELIEDMTGEQYEEQFIKESYFDVFNLIEDSPLSRYISVDYEQMFREDDYATETSYGVLLG